jgi:hypothetical protein
MAYIGREPTVGNFQVCDAISVVNNQAAYTMQVSGVNATPQSANHMLVSLNGILQQPNSSFTVSGSTITFASNLVTGDVIDFIQILGDVLDLGVPSDNTVTTAKLSDSSVSLAKLTATGTKDATTFLRGDNTFNAPPLGGITEADMWRTTTDTSGASGTFSSNWERVDTYSFSHLGTGMSQSSGIFTFPSTGFYRISFQSNFTGTSIQYAGIILMLTTDNSSYNQHVKQYTSLGNSSYETSVSLEGIVDITNVSTHKVRFDQQQSGSGGVWAGGSSNRTSATFIKLADT